MRTKKSGLPVKPASNAGSPEGPKPIETMSFDQYKAKHGHKMPPWHLRVMYRAYVEEAI